MGLCKRCIDLECYSSKSTYCLKCREEVNREKSNRYHFKNKEKRNLSSKEYKNKNRDHIHDYNQFYALKNKEELSKKRKEKRESDDKFRNKLNQDSIEWRKNNKDKIKKYNRKHVPLYRKKYPWLYACRVMINNTVKRFGTKKADTTINLLGYSALDLKNHLENKFLPNMSWDNYGIWHIDHIMPVSKFTKDTPMNVVNSLDNLQPLWGVDNLSKGNRT
jgi:hypothetical protein